MIDRQLRARVLLPEAHALGLDVADLVAADTNTAARLPTVAEFIEMIAPTFTPATAATSLQQDPGQPRCPRSPG